MNQPQQRPTHHRAKLSAEQVREIRSSTQPGKIFAINHQVTEAAISQIRSGKRWKWLR